MRAAVCVFPFSTTVTRLDPGANWSSIRAAVIAPVTGERPSTNARARATSRCKFLVRIGLRDEVCRIVQLRDERGARPPRNHEERYSHALIGNRPGQQSNPERPEHHRWRRDVMEVVRVGAAEEERERKQAERPRGNDRCNGRSLDEDERPSLDEQEHDRRCGHEVERRKRVSRSDHGATSCVPNFP